MKKSKIILIIFIVIMSIMPSVVNGAHEKGIEQNNFESIMVIAKDNKKGKKDNTGGSATSTSSATGDDKLDAIITAMSGVKNGAGDPTTGIGKIIQIIIKCLQVSGTSISLIVITVMGIKYMISSGSEKADIKKHLVPSVIGSVLLFAAVNIVAILADISITIGPG